MPPFTARIRLAARKRLLCSIFRHQDPVAAGRARHESGRVLMSSALVEVEGECVSADPEFVTVGQRDAGT